MIKLDTSLPPVALAFKRSGTNRPPLKFYLKKVKDDPKSPVCLINAGYSYRRLHLDDEALDCFQKAYDLAPDSIVTVMALAGFKALKGKYCEVEDLYLDSFTRGHSRDVRLLTALGNLYQKWEKMDLARESFTRACTLPEADDYARKRLAEIIKHFGDSNAPETQERQP